MDNVLADVVKEAGVVGDNDGSAGGVDKVLLEPLDVLHVQVVGRLVKQQNIGGLEDGTAQSQLHLPTTREGRDFTLDHGVGEAKVVELPLDVRLGDVDASLAQLLHGPLNGGHLSIGRVKVVLDENGLDFALLGEALDLLVVDGAHEGRLAGAVGTAETIALAALETQVRLVKEDLGTVGQGESAVAQVLTLLLIGLNLLLVSGSRRSTLAEGVDDALGVINAGDDSNVSLQVVNPDGVLELLFVDELAGHGGNVFKDGAHFLNVRGVLGGEDILELAEDNVEVTVVAGLGDLAVLDVADTVKGVKGLLGLLTGLGVSQVIVVLLETRHHLGQERSDNVGIVDKLAHVVNNDGRFSLDGGLALGKTTIQKGDHEGQGRLLDLGDESGGTEQVNRLRDVLGFGDTLDELGNEALDIPVDDELADGLHGLVGTLLDLLLGVPHGLGDDGDQVRDAVGELSRGSRDEGINEVQGGHLLRPLLSVADRVHDGRKGGLAGIAAHATSNGEDGGGSGILDSSRLVANNAENVGEEDNQIRLHGSGDLSMRGNGLNGYAGLLAGNGILFVGKLLLQVRNGPIKAIDG